MPFAPCSHSFTSLLLSRARVLSLIPRFTHKYGSFASMAARILANLLVAGSMVVGRAVIQAYQKAIQNANKTGVAHEALNNIQRVRKAMTEQEARLILGIGEKSTWEETLQKYDALFEKNAKNGSFYLQSKVHRAKECLEAVYQSKGEQPTSQH